MVDESNVYLFSCKLTNVIRFKKKILRIGILIYIFNIIQMKSLNVFRTIDDKIKFNIQNNYRIR